MIIIIINKIYYLLISYIITVNYYY